MASVPVVSFFAYAVAKNWVAGKSIPDVILEAKLANRRGFRVIVNFLGEEIRNAAEVEESVEEYKRVLGALQSSGIDGCISVKPTQIGLGINRELFRGNLEKIVAYAGRLGRFVWVDMEGSWFTGATLDAYCALHSRRKNVGVCVQSYLKRSRGDVERLVGIGGKIRLVKGAYNEPASIAYKAKAEVDRNFVKLMEYLFQNSANLFSVSTHDDELVYRAVALSRKHKRGFEFGFLKGIRDKLKFELVQRGFRITEYIPYGENWLPYSIRRVREKPSNVLLLLRSLISK